MTRVWEGYEPRIYIVYVYIFYSVKHKGQTSVKRIRFRRANTCVCDFESRFRTRIDFSDGFRGRNRVKLITYWSSKTFDRLSPIGWCFL